MEGWGWKRVARGYSKEKGLGRGLTEIAMVAVAAAADPAKLGEEASGASSYE